MKANVVNFHITDKCNFRCSYCFARFGQRDLPLDDAKRVIDSVGEYFMVNGIPDGRINIAGGEPFVYKHLSEIIGYIKSKGIGVSVITNGLLVNTDMRDTLAQLDMLGISIDAASDSCNKCLGRSCGSVTQDFEALGEVTDLLHEMGVRVKVNTVVSRLNLDEDLKPIYNRLRPDKIKLVCVHSVENINGDDVRNLVPSDEEYRDFVRRNTVEGIKTVIEERGYMQNSYLMINPQGEVFMNERGVERKFGSCLEAPLYKIYETLPIDEEKFFLRYT